MKFLIIHNTASRGNYLPRPIRLPFFFSSCDESVPPSRWLQCPCWGRTEFVQCLCRKACFSGVYYSAVKMCSRQKLGILSLISEVIGGDFEKKKKNSPFFLFTGNLRKGNKKVENLLLETVGFAPMGFPLRFVLYYF